MPAEKSKKIKTTKQHLFRGNGYKLTINQKRFADKILAATQTNKKNKVVPTRIAQEVYGTNYATSAVTASNLLKNPNVLAYLEAHKDKAQQNIIHLADGAKSESVRLQANVDILDRTTGKATQKLEVEQKVITVNLSFQNALPENQSGQN